MNANDKITFFLCEEMLEDTKEQILLISKRHFDESMFLLTFLL